MNKTEYIGKLNALYVGDKNCLEELITIYDEKDKEIERLNKRIKELEEGFKATTEDLCEESTKIEKSIEYIEKHTYHDTPKKLQNGIYERGILLIKSDFDIEELLEILDKENI